MAFSSTIRRVPYSAISRRKEPKSVNGDIKALHSFFSRIVKASGDNSDITLMKITKSLATSRINRPPVKVSVLAKMLEGSDKTIVFVGKVLDDDCVFELPAMKVVALHWSKTAQKKIEANGGSIHTLDQFIRVAGSMENVLLVKGDIRARKANKFFGASPGERGSTAYPRSICKGRNREKRLNVKKPISYDSDSE